MGRFRFVKARNYKDYWIINELVEHCNEEGKDGRFRWCYTSTGHVTLPFIDDGWEAKLVVTKDGPPRIVGFYAYTSELQRLDVLYVVPKMRGRRVAVDMVDNFTRMFPRDAELQVLRPCLAVRRMLNRHFPGRFRAVEVERDDSYIVHYAEEDLGQPEAWLRA